MEEYRTNAGEPDDNLNIIILFFTTQPNKYVKILIIRL